MRRIWDYIGFAVWFAGLGYFVMWLLRSPDLALLPPAMHVLGSASALLVPVLSVWRLIQRRRAAAEAVPTRKPAVVLRPPRPKSSYPMRRVKARSHFGLRGTPD
jgi:hypothetical protein